MMHDSCQRCKALGIDTNGYVCHLDYKLDKKTGVPLEECSKPLLYLDYLEEKKERMIQH